MKIKIVTLFKEMFIPFLETSIIKRAINNKLVEVELVDLRTYSMINIIMLMIHLMVVEVEWLLGLTWLREL